MLIFIFMLYSKARNYLLISKKWLSGSLLKQIQHGLDINEFIQDKIPLVLDCQYNQNDIVSGLLAWGANPQALFDKQNANVTIYAWVLQNKPELTVLFRPYLNKALRKMNSLFGRQQWVAPALKSLTASFCVVQ